MSYAVIASNFSYRCEIVTLGRNFIILKMFSLLLYIFSSAIPVVGYYFQKSYYRPQPLNNNMNNSGFEPTNNNVHNFVPPNNIPEDCRKKQGKESSAECEPNVPSNQFKTIPLQKLNDEDPRNFWHKIW